MDNRDLPNSFLLYAGIVVALLLLAPYLGIHPFGRGATSNVAVPVPEERQIELPEINERNDNLPNVPVLESTPKSLDEIESMLKN